MSAAAAPSRDARGGTWCILISSLGSRYIKTYLLPDKSNRSKRKTTVRKRSLDPIFNETLKVWGVPGLRVGAWLWGGDLILPVSPHTSTSWRRGSCRAGP